MAVVAPIRPAAQPVAPPQLTRVSVLGARQPSGGTLARLLARHPRFEPVGDVASEDAERWHRIAPAACVNLLRRGAADAALQACRRRKLPVVDLSGALWRCAADDPRTLHGTPAVLGQAVTLARRVAIPPVRAAVVSLAVGPLARAGVLDPDATICVVSNGAAEGDLERDATEAQALINSLGSQRGAPTVLLVARRQLDVQLTTRVRLGRLSAGDARAIFREAYHASPTVTVADGAGAGPEPVMGTHLARLGFEEDPAGLWLECVVDGTTWLVGQILEALNRMFGLPPELGLCLPPASPCEADPPWVA